MRGRQILICTHLIALYHFTYVLFDAGICLKVVCPAGMETLGERHQTDFGHLCTPSLQSLLGTS